jgi:hypothetical protein
MYSTRWESRTNHSKIQIVDELEPDLLGDTRLLKCIDVSTLELRVIVRPHLRKNESKGQSFLSWIRSRTGFPKDATT